MADTWWQGRWCLCLLLWCWCLLYCDGYTYTNQTQRVLCEAQCEALYLDNQHDETSGGANCNGTRTWATKCNIPNCPGTCSTLLNNFYLHRQLLEPVPNVTVSQTGDKSVELSWLPAVPISPQNTIYIIEETRHDQRYPTISTVALIGWVRDAKYHTSVSEVCSLNSYRVMAVNQYGSMGFSLRVKVPGLRPGPVTNIQYVGRGMYYAEDLDPNYSKFMAILKWDPPPGWKHTDIARYEWNPMMSYICVDVTHDSIPIFTPMKNHTNHFLVEIPAVSIGCSFHAQVKAVSNCGVVGPWTNFTIDLTNCSAITGYFCQDLFKPPGTVANVSLAVTSTPYDLMQQWVSSSYQPPAVETNPLLINLHISWSPPPDMGSSSSIQNYIIRSGRAHRLFTPLPPDFVDTPQVKNVSGNIVELIFRLPTQKIPYLYGVQVIAVAPNQVIPDNEIGIYPMYTIQVDRNDSIGSLRKQGKILLDEAGIVIVFINNTLPATFMLDSPQGRTQNYTSIDRYALQWGPLVGPNELYIENRTIIPMMKYLYEAEDDPGDEEWEDLPLLSFDLPGVDGDDTNSTYMTIENIEPESPFNMVPVYILAAVVLVVAIVTVILVRLHRRRHFKHLERRLADGSEIIDGDHYFVMRPTDTSDDDDLVATVVTDAWELPHSCLKVGRILGSGAFGQVAKGRVSKSMLMHRGIDLHDIQNRDGTHITVAIKMLQEYSEERHATDFLNEIQMMKDIGYHRNVVSILGCCTLRQPYCLVVEHVPHGDLLTYLRKIRHKIQEMEDLSGPYINREVEFFTPNDLLSIARQITKGMEYLSQKGFVHRDLAARNILVGDGNSVKIADFGLTRYIYHDIHKIYVNRNGGKLPLKWMAPESIFELTFSAASDVWSFGILLYEIVTLGGMPYPMLSNRELLRSIKQGYKMERPDNCSMEIYEVMKQCWSLRPNSRPSFSELQDTFTSMLEDCTDLEYFSFKIEEEHDYYRINSDDIDVEDLEDDEISDTQHQDNPETQAHRSMADIVREIPNENCSVHIPVLEDNCKSGNVDIGDIEAPLDDCKYTNRAFSRSRSSTSSFHNGLYPGLSYDDIVEAVAASTESSANINHDKLTDTSTGNPKDDEYGVAKIEFTDVVSQTENLLGKSGTISPFEDFSVPRSSRLETDRISGSSDDVFTDCPGCLKLNVPFADSSTKRCTECGRMDVRLTMQGVHAPTQRNDSGICSITSDEVATPTQVPSSETSVMESIHEKPHDRNESCSYETGYDYGHTLEKGQKIGNWENRQMMEKWEDTPEIEKCMQGRSKMEKWKDSQEMVADRHSIKQWETKQKMGRFNFGNDSYLTRICLMDLVGDVKAGTSCDDRKVGERNDVARRVSLQDPSYDYALIENIGEESGHLSIESTWF